MSESTRRRVDRQEMQARMENSLYDSYGMYADCGAVISGPPLMKVPNK